MSNNVEKKSLTTAEFAALRAVAEAALKSQQADLRMPRSDADVRKLLHELQVSQIELEMQNAALSKLQQEKIEIEAGLARYTDLYDLAPVGYFTLDGNGRLFEINLTCAKLLGSVRSQLIGKHFSTFLSDASRPVLQIFLHTVFASHTKQSCELTILGTCYSPLHVHISAKADDAGYTCRAAMEDISERMAMTQALHKAHAELEAKVETRTAELVHANVLMKTKIAERKLAEQALQQSQQDLRQLVGHQLSIKETERTRIALEIHDELGSLLTGIKGNIYAAMHENEKSGAPPSQCLIDASVQADEAAETMRRVIADLRPSVLDQLGLWAALEWQAEQTATFSGLKCHFTIDEVAAATIIDPEHSTALFRIMQETLTNVVRHAKATQVEIAVIRDNNAIRMTVEDDGQGIVATRQRHHRSWGIAGMIERARYFGGEIHLSDTSHGTKVIVRMPLDGPVLR
jgi:PAS domain S-box-containing protein